MELRIMDYKHRRKTVNLGSNVAKIKIKISFGDEIAYVTYADGEVVAFDSCDEKRTKDIIEQSYTLYQDGQEIPKKWERRKDSYDGHIIIKELDNGDDDHPKPQA